jgi:AraC-like DNA-binding protein
VQFAVQCGADHAALLAGAGVSREQLSDPDRRLPLSALPAMFESAARVLGDDAFALRFGVGVPCAQLTLASVLAAAQPEATPLKRAAAETEPRTLRDALHGLNRYASLGVDFGAALPGDRYRFVSDDHGVWLEDLRPSADIYAWPLLTESVFARFATGIRKRGGEYIVRALAVTHAAPASTVHREAYAHVFRVPVTFGAARNAVCLDHRFLEQPLEPLAAPVQDVLIRHADAQLQLLRSDTTWRTRVERLLRAELEGAGTGSSCTRGIERVCRELAVGRHTLHRRLQEEGTTFVALYDGIRRDMADTLLRTPTLTVDAVALRLGFSEAAAFSRAYKRWTGRRPGAVRRAG